MKENIRRRANCFFLWTILVSAIGCAQPVQTGLDRILEFSHHFQDKNIGIVTNHTAVNSEGVHITELFLSMPEVRVVALFGPEHGVWGQAAAGERVQSEFGLHSQIPIYSLYGATKTPTADMLNRIDLLVFDMQDIGARFYTYIWTMFKTMQAAAENDIPIVVLDRPNPITGKTGGPVLDMEFSSFLGLAPIPVEHGMTIGELANMFNGEGWLGDGLKTKLTVIPMRGWSRDMWYDETGLEFIPPSPNMPNLETAIVYPGLCLLEGTNISEGRGTEAPFITFGAPWIDTAELCDSLNALFLPGVEFLPAQFTPQHLPGKAPHPKFENQLCFGANLVVTDRHDFRAVYTGVHIVDTLFRLYPDHFTFRQDHYFDLLCGSDAVRQAILNGDNLKEMYQHWQDDLEAFRTLRQPYLLYE